MVKVIDINNLKSNETDMFLKKKMEEVSMDSQELAYKLKVSPVTTYRWLKGERKISPEQAIEIAKIIQCNPADILFPAKKIDSLELHGYAEDYIVKRLHKKNYREIIIPGGFYTPQTKAIQFYAPGREAHNEIHLFERGGTTDYDYNGFSEDAINSTCYVEPTEKSRKKGCRDVICLIEIDKTQTTFRLNLLHPETKKPMTKNTSTNVDPRDIKIAAPRKMTFFESYNKYKPGRLPSNKINPFQ
jgi:DNA-binding transcriptional regulator YdaS (Cro superfamily)